MTKYDQRRPKHKGAYGKNRSYHLVVRLDSETRDQLYQLSDRQDLAIASIVRHLIEQHLKEQEIR